MEENKCFFIVSRYNEDVSWLKNYSNKHLIYNKGDDDLDGYNFIEVQNIGGNQHDICHYIHTNYDNLPATMAFVQGDPYDHCAKEKFDKLIKQNWFAPLEAYEHLKENRCHKKCKIVDWGYMEKNNSWFISAHNTHIAEKGFNARCPYKSFDDFMVSFFHNYKHIEWLRFAPGAQYLVEKERCLQYPKSFWKSLIDLFPQDELINGGTEAHIIERSLWFIFNGVFKSRDNPIMVSSKPVDRIHLGRFLPGWIKRLI